MKKLLFSSAFFLVTFSAFSQSKWFFSIETGYGFGGPLGSIKKNMEKSNLNQHSPDIDFFGLIFYGSDFPKKTVGIPTLFKVGKKIKEGRSVYIEAGISTRGEVVGFQNIGYYGNTIRVNYLVRQLTAGYQYSFAKSSSKVGWGPSLFMLHYSDDYKALSHRSSYSSFVPGISAMARLPLGKEKHLIGVDIVTELNLAPPAKMKEIQKSTFTMDYSGGGSISYTSTLKAAHVNMVHGMVGLALSVRSKTKK